MSHRVSIGAIVALAIGISLTNASAERGEEASGGDATEELKAIEPGRYRGRYVSPLGPGAKLDPYAPGPNSPYWMPYRPEGPGGKLTFPPDTLKLAEERRFEKRDPVLGLDLAINLDTEPQPFMRVEEKIYAVRVVPEVSVVCLTARVNAEVGEREFEREWFTAFKGQSATVSGIEEDYILAGRTAEFEVEESDFRVLQKTKVDESGKVTHHAVYEGSLTLDETLLSCVKRVAQRAISETGAEVYGLLLPGVAGWFGVKWIRRRKQKHNAAEAKGEQKTAKTKAAKWSTANRGRKAKTKNRRKRGSRK